MTLSWNEIKDRALKFSKEWADGSNEDADISCGLLQRLWDHEKAGIYL